MKTDSDETLPHSRGSVDQGPVNEGLCNSALRKTQGSLQVQVRKAEQKRAPCGRPLLKIADNGPRAPQGQATR